MNKVYVVFKENVYINIFENVYSGSELLSIHATQEGAEKECERLHKRRGISLNSYFWEDMEVQP